ncbi:MAG TPA: four-carbon acid sugar kinase family protein [Opitutaceae bacterium]
MPKAVLAGIPPARPPDAEAVRRGVHAVAAKAVILDDDPTGTQTVHGLDVLADSSVAALSSSLRDSRPAFFVLTNSRSLPEADAETLVRRVSENLAAASRETGVPFTLILRGDSTLRGHFSAELRATEAGIGLPFDATIVIPAFFEGGRQTIGNVHYVASGENLVPVAETEFARDRTFGFKQSDLTRWIEEKSLGAVRARDVATLGLETIRSPDGAGRVKETLLGLPKGAFLIVNAAEYADLEVFALGLLGAESRGRRYLLRTAASFVKVRAAVGTRALLAPAEYSSGPLGALVVVGSYVEKTTRQLEELLGLPFVEGIELRLGALGAAGGGGEPGAAAGRASAVIASGRTAAVFTSRGLDSPLGRAGDLGTGRIVSAAIAEMVRCLSARPRYLLAKGGITSYDVAVAGLGMRKARILGQAAPGVPVWEMGPETLQPGLRVIVWPGNVGEPPALRDLVSASQGRP